jgi:hypothetical protein
MSLFRFNRKMQGLLYPVFILPLSQFIASKSLTGAIVFLGAVGIVEIFPKQRNHYETLGLSLSCSRQDVARAYRYQSLQYHPDKTGGNAGERFLALQEAYEALSSPTARPLYNLHGPKAAAQLRSMSADDFDQHELTKIGMAAGVRVLVAGVFTASPQTTLARRWVFGFIFFAAAVEVLTRFLDGQELFGRVPVLAEYPPFQQADVVNAAFSSVLSIAVLVSRQLFTDPETALLVAAQAAADSNVEIAEALLTREPASVEPAAVKFANGLGRGGVRRGSSGGGVRRLGSWLFWAYMAKLVYTELVLPYVNNYF